MHNSETVPSVRLTNGMMMRTELLNFTSLAAADDTLLGSFGVAAAVLLVGGSVLLRWQRNRQQFLLMQTALLQGLKQFPAGPPAWLATLRQGITSLALGIGLIVVGGIAYLLGARVEPPTQQQLQAYSQQPAQAGRGLGQLLGSGQRPAQRGPNPNRPDPNRVEGNGRPEDIRPEDLRPQDMRPENVRPGDPPPRGPLSNPGGARPDDARPENRPRDGEMDANGRPLRAPMNPLLDRWHFAQSEKTVGLLGMGAGIVLTLLGLVQVGFSGVEKRHAPVPTEQNTTAV